MNTKSTSDTRYFHDIQDAISQALRCIRSEERQLRLLDMRNPLQVARLSWLFDLRMQVIDCFVALADAQSDLQASDLGDDERASVVQSAALTARAATDDLETADDAAKAVDPLLNAVASVACAAKRA